MTREKNRRKDSRDSKDNNPPQNEKKLSHDLDRDKHEDLKKHQHGEQTQEKRPSNSKKQKKPHAKNAADEVHEDEKPNRRSEDQGKDLGEKGENPKPKQLRRSTTEEKLSFREPKEEVEKMKFKRLSFINKRKNTNVSETQDHDKPIEDQNEEEAKKEIHAETAKQEGKGKTHKHEKHGKKHKKHSHKKDRHGSNQEERKESEEIQPIKEEPISEKPNTVIVLSGIESGRPPPLPNEPKRLKMCGMTVSCFVFIICTCVIIIVLIPAFIVISVYTSKDEKKPKI